MNAKFKVGDNVHLNVDCITIYRVAEIRKTSVAFFYDLINVTNGSHLSDIAEHDLRAM